MTLDGRPTRSGKLPTVVTVAQLQPSEVPDVDRCLPLNRLDHQRAEGSTYLVAWDDDQPIGHAHIAWVGTHLGIPEIQDVFVVPERRRAGIAAQLTDAAEGEARVRGWDSISLGVSQDGNVAARKLYAKLGYADAGVDPVRVFGTFMLRGRPFEVDDTLVYLVKGL
jgi:GNAT superfamily N-acetyltransferase